MKNILAFITAAIMSVVSISGSFNVSAEEYGYEHTNPIMQNDIYMTGTNSFGDMIAAELSAKQTEQNENNGYNVFSIEMTGKLANVEFQTFSDAKLIVGIYSDDERQLIATGSKDVSSDDTETLVEIEISTMPQYYYIKAYLVNSDTMRPLCTVYECPTYTQEMQDFLKKTVNDFNSDRVLNLDNDPTNNFAVYNDNIIIIPQTGANNVVSVDDENGIYVINNADENFTSLKNGDTFSYTYDNAQVLIVNIKNISVYGDTVTITGNENVINEIFDYVKIDTSVSESQISIDTSTIGEGVSFNGTIDKVDNILNETSPAFNESCSPFSARGFDIDITASGKMKPVMFSIDKTFSSGAKIEGSIAISAKPELKIYISKELKSVEFSIDYELAINGEISEKIEAVSIPLGELNVSTVPGVFIGLKLKFIVESNTKATITYKIGGTVGFKHDNKNGSQSINKPVIASSELKINGTVFIGIDFGPALEVLHEKIAGASVSSKVGVEIKGVILDTSKMTEVELHDCKLCYDGKINIKFSLSYEVTLLDIDALTLSGDFVDFEFKLKDWYYSDTFKEFAFTNCPHRKFKYLISVRENNIPTEAAVTIDGVNHKTDANGQLKLFLSTGTHEIMAYKDSYSSKKLTVSVGKSAGAVNLNLVPAVCTTPNTPSEPSSEIKFKQTGLGTQSTAILTIDGDLYTVGANYYGELGNGTDDQSSISVKILDNVKYVYLAQCHYGAAITTNGDLYTWGFNQCGKLGNGTTIDSYIPIKIMSNVSSVSLGTNHCAAITTSGDLYTWGYNAYGQLGDGTTNDRYTPQKIMSNVSFTALGEEHSSAITTNGDLYTWGYNFNGQLGDGTVNDKYTPQKIMNNVASISLGSHSSAAITTSGDLYTWGSNYRGVLGNGTSDGNTYVPIKIMGNASFVSLSNYHGAVITTGGDLYTWGLNAFGQLGDGTTNDSYTPQKIMSNVIFTDLGAFHSSAITTSGDLYTWGDNYCGQLGNGTTTDCNVPTKITIPTTSSHTETKTIALAAYSSAPPNRTITGLLPNEVYNIYGMKSRMAENPFDADNLLYVSQAITDASGILTFEYLPNEECVNPEIFVKAMREFDVPNARITDAESNNQSVSLKWEPVSGAGKYTVYTVRNGEYVKEAEVTETEYTVNGLTNGTQYGFIIQSCVYGELSFLDNNDIIYSTPKQTILLGDVNGDGKITAADLILVRRYIAHLSSEISPAADLNGDGKITAADLILLRRMYAGN